MLRHGFAPAFRLDPGPPRGVVKCQPRHVANRSERQPGRVGVGPARRPRRLAGVVAGFRRVAAEAQRRRRDVCASGPRRARAVDDAARHARRVQEPRREALREKAALERRRRGPAVARQSPSVLIPADVDL